MCVCVCVCVCCHAMEATKTHTDTHTHTHTHTRTRTHAHTHTHKQVSACNGGYHDMSGMAFTDAAAQINRHRPHILVNLDGWTSAPLINEIVILTPAPVQVNLRTHIRKPKKTHECA
jgi:prophage tail gpP-like protein